VGANPYKLGFVGASDSHSGPSNGDENAFAGQSGIVIDPDKSLPSRDVAEHILAPPPPPVPGGRFPGLGRLSGSAGITGVWAEHNDRDSIYAALRRKETFATSGPEIRLRCFGGWKVLPGALTHSDWVTTAYRTGVAMGADPLAKPESAPARDSSFRRQKIPSVAVSIA
jgi:uncharacterized protein DUF3604